MSLKENAEACKTDKENEKTLNYYIIYFIYIGLKIDVPCLIEVASITRHEQVSHSNFYGCHPIFTRTITLVAHE